MALATQLAPVAVITKILLSEKRTTVSFILSVISKPSWLVCFCLELIDIAKNCNKITPKASTTVAKIGLEPIFPPKL